MSDRLTVVLADDHTAVLDAVGRVLETAGIHVLATAADGIAAVEAIELHSPVVAVLDVRMPKLSEIEVARRAAELTNVCIYTGHRERALLLDVIGLGVRGMVDLVHAIRAVASGAAYFDPVLAGLLLQADGTRRSATPCTSRRTPFDPYPQRVAKARRGDAHGGSCVRDAP